MFSLLICNPVNAYNGAYNVEITEKYVKSTAKCSCSLQHDYKRHTHYFLNYCPHCHHKGCLQFEQIKGHNDEGMWYCSNCDADYCLVHGKEHISGSNYYLVPYKPVKHIKPAVVKAVDKKTLFLNHFKSYKLF